MTGLDDRIPAPAGPHKGWYYGWNIVAVCVLAQVAAYGLSVNTFSLFLHGWAHDLHTPISHLQLVVTGQTIGSAISGPIAGVLADKLPARRLFVTGLLGMALFYFLVASVTATWQLATFYIVLSTPSMALCTAVPASAVISRWFDRRRGLALGLCAFGIGMGGVILPPLIGAALPHVGWRVIWRLAAALIAFVVTPAVIWVLRDRPTEREGLHYLLQRDEPTAGVGNLKWSDVLKRGNFWLLIVAFVAISGLKTGVLQNIAPLAASRGYSEQFGGWALAIISFANLSATLAVGMLADRFGVRLPYAGLALSVTAGAILLAFGTGLPALLLACVLIGFGGGQLTLLAAALAKEFGAAGVGRAYGLCLIFTPVASLGGFAIARSQEMTGAYTDALVGLAILTFLSGAAILSLRGHAVRPLAVIPVKAL